MVAVLLGAGCGSGRTGLTAVEQNQLLDLIRQARVAATAGDFTSAATALGELRANVSQLRRVGVLDAARAARIQSVAAQAVNGARAPAPSVTARPDTTPSAVPASPPPAATATPAPGSAQQIITQGAGAAGDGQPLSKQQRKLQKEQAKAGGGGD